MIRQQNKPHQPHPKDTTQRHAKGSQRQPIRQPLKRHTPAQEPRPQPDLQRREDDAEEGKRRQQPPKPALEEGRVARREDDVALDDVAPGAQRPQPRERVEPRQPQLPEPVPAVDRRRRRVRVEARHQVADEGRPGRVVEPVGEQQRLLGEGEVASVLHQPGVREQEADGAGVRPGIMIVIIIIIMITTTTTITTTHKGAGGGAEVVFPKGMAHKVVRQGLEKQMAVVPHEMLVGPLRQQDGAVHEPLAQEGPRRHGQAGEPQVGMQGVELGRLELEPEERGEVARGREEGVPPADDGREHDLVLSEEARGGAEGWGQPALFAAVLNEGEGMSAQNSPWYVLGWAREGPHLVSRSSGR